MPRVDCAFVSGFVISGRRAHRCESDNGARRSFRRGCRHWPLGNTRMESTLPACPRPCRGSTPPHSPRISHSSGIVGGPFAARHQWLACTSLNFFLVGGWHLRASRCLGAKIDAPSARAAKTSFFSANALFFGPFCAAAASFQFRYKPGLRPTYGEAPTWDPTAMP